MLKDRSFSFSTFDTSEVNLLQLWINTSSFGHDSFNLDQLIKMNLSQVSQVILNRKISDSYVNIFRHLLIKRIDLKSQLISNAIKNRYNSTRMFSNPNRKSWHFKWNMPVGHFEWSLVVLTHFWNSCLINILALFVFEVSQELSKWLFDELNSFLLFDPLWDFSCQSFFHIIKVLFFFLHLINLICISISSMNQTYIFFFTLRVSHHCHWESSFLIVLLVFQVE